MLRASFDCTACKYWVQLRCCCCIKRLTATLFRTVKRTTIPGVSWKILDPEIHTFYYIEKFSLNEIYFLSVWLLMHRFLPTDKAKRG